MKLKPLTKPMRGISFWIWRFLLHFNLAKPFYWGESIGLGKSRNTYLFSIHFVQKPTLINHKVVMLKALVTVILPIKITIGYINNNE